MRIVSVVGARPQFIKLAVMCRALASRSDSKPWSHRIVHTGQHYDPELSSAFFAELDIPAPDFDLGVGSGGHGEQTGEMLRRLEPLLIEQKPDWVLLYGDTNSTLAGALAAAKLDLRIAHIESGLRSHCRAMPEEINRVVADRLSDLLFCPTPLAVENLRQEGLADRVVLSGDVMFDASLAFREVAEARETDLSSQWRPREFALATVHRAANTDDAATLQTIVAAIDQVARNTCPVVWPMHPRTRNKIADFGISTGSICVIQPLSYLRMLLLESRARFVLTDSGGVQKEAYFLKVPCITLRDETEWEETLENRCNVLVGCSAEKIASAIARIDQAGPWTAVYGNGNAGGAILDSLLAYRD